MTSAAAPEITCVLARSRHGAGDLRPHGIAVSALAADGEEALASVLAHRPDVVVLPARMSRRSAIDVVRTLAEHGSQTRVILLADAGEQAVLVDALEAGVAGLLDESAPLEDLPRAIRVVASGAMYVDPSLGALLLGGGLEVMLTPRERDVLKLLADGLANGEIGERLGVSPQTVRTHLQRAMARLGASTRTQAVAIALRRALI